MIEGPKADSVTLPHPNQEENIIGIKEDTNFQVMSNINSNFKGL